MLRGAFQSRFSGFVGRFVAGIILLLAVAAVYVNSLGSPFVFDDIPSVVRNPTIRQLWPPWSALSPPVDGSGSSGRPLVNFSFAVNYAVDGLSVRGYHLANLILHGLAGLALWGVLRRTAGLCCAEQPSGGLAVAHHRRDTVSPSNGLFPEYAELFAWTTALLWAVHPLLTESVVCVVQRNEVLGSLFCLLTLYAFIRGTKYLGVLPPPALATDRRHSVRWLTLSLLACLAGMASKEIAVTAPLLVFLYDRTFVSGTFREVWRRRKKYYLLLGATWIFLGFLVWHNRQRGGTAGFSDANGGWEYLLTQSRAILLYLKLTVWPQPLVLDYGWPTVRSLGEVWWQAPLVVALITAAVVAFWRKSIPGFLAFTFFILLAPSSSFVPLRTQTIAEHRMYLPLAAGLSLLVAFILTQASRMGKGSLRFAAAGLVVVAMALGFATAKRNTDYRSELSIWTDTVGKCPDNARAHGNLGRAYLSLGRWEEGIAACREELRIDPNYRGDGRVNIARALTELGRPAEALPYFEEGLRLRPDAFDVRNNYGIALAALGRWSEAVAQYREALRLEPDFADGYNNLANASVRLGLLDEAIGQYGTALRLRPDLIETQINLGRTLAEAGRVSEALPYFEKAMLVRPNSAEAHEDLANALATIGRPSDAITHYGTALRLQPDRATAHLGIGNLLASQGRMAEAVGHYESAASLRPELVTAQHNLAAALMRLDRATEALPHFEATVRLLPDSAEAHHELSLVLGELQRWNEAIRHDQEALRLNPGLSDAKEHLEWLQQRE